MSEKVSAAAFAAFLNERLAAKDGYIMGATGQDPRTWSETSWWFTQYSGSQRTKALSWRANAERVWDCAGLAEGYYRDMTGRDVNTRARYIYANWCPTKGTGRIPAKHRLPGAAVFIHSTSEGAITHVGYLVEPIDPADPSGDWYVIEARGVMYGVVRTKLSARPWNRWGLMEKYFDYAGISSDAGSASGSTSSAAQEPAPASTVAIAPGTWNVRTGPGTAYPSVAVVKGGETLTKVEAGEWLPVLHNGQIRWISPKASSASSPEVPA